MKKIVRIMICFIITFSMIFGMTHASFATMQRIESNKDVISTTNTIVMEALKNVRIEKVDITTKLIEDNIKDDSKLLKFDEKHNKLNIQSDEIWVSAFKNEGRISFATDAVPEVSVNLPCKESARAILSNNGTAVYNVQESSYEMAVQVRENAFDDIKFKEFKTFMKINNRVAPSKYTFSYELPKGYIMMNIQEYAEQYASQQEKIELGDIEDAIVIVDENKSIVYTIDAMQAEDSLGNKVNTHHILEGNEVTQIVELDDDTNFPVILYNATHPDYKKTKYLNKSEVKKVRDRYSGSSISMIAAGIASLGISALSTPVGVAYTIISTAIGAYDQYSFNTWDKFYTTMVNKPSYKYLRTVTTYHYHPGKRTYYPKNCKYAFVKG